MNGLGWVVFYSLAGELRNLQSGTPINWSLRGLPVVISKIQLGCGPGEMRSVSFTTFVAS